MRRLREWKEKWGVIVLCLVAAGAFTGVLYLVHESHDRPTAEQFCKGHGGVRNLDVGGFYATPVATCMDGTAGRVWL